MSERFKLLAIAGSAVALFLLASIYAGTNGSTDGRTTVATAQSGEAYVPRRWDSRPGQRHLAPWDADSAVAARGTREMVY